MAFIEWDQSLMTGVRKFDDDHKTLVTLINKLHDAIETGAENKTAREIIDSLVTYTKTHFQSEECQMLFHNYPDYVAQKKEHNILILQVCEMQKKMTGGTALPINLMQFMKDWLIIHIMGDDKKYGPFFTGKEHR